MKYISAYMLAKLGGKDDPSVEDIKNIIESVGIEFDAEKANSIVNKLKGKDINEVINEGSSKLSVVSGGQSVNQEQQQASNDTKAEEDKKEEEEQALGFVIGEDFEDIFS